MNKRSCVSAITGLTLMAFTSGCDHEMLNQSELLNPSHITEKGSDIARTFDEAIVILPGPGDRKPLQGKFSSSAILQLLANTPTGWQYPTILYMHGCAGYGSLAPLKAFAQAGFAVIAPNSFARRYRPLQCHPSKKTGGHNIFIYDFRLVEISYALQRMAALSWIDNDNLFLVGTSEGGVAAALYRGEEFRARIIAQWTCNGLPFVRGLAAPEGEPVLAIVRSDDPWYQPERTSGQLGHCGNFFKTPNHSRSMIFDGGGGHDVWTHADAMAAAIKFLRNR